MIIRVVRDIYAPENMDKIVQMDLAKASKKIHL